MRDLQNTIPIEQALAYCFALTGLKEDNYPEGVARQVLIDFIKTSYPGHVAEEIKEAFKLALGEKLNIKPEDVKHYQNFNSEYLSRIMRAYNVYRSQELTKETNKVKKTDFRPVQDLNYHLLLKMYGKSLKSGQYLFRPDIAAYGFGLFENYGIIEMTPDEKRQWSESLKEDFVKQKKKNGANAYSLDNEMNMNVFKRHCRIEKFKEKVLELIFDEADIRDLLN